MAGESADSCAVAGVLGRRQLPPPPPRLRSCCGSGPYGGQPAAAVVGGGRLQKHQRDLKMSHNLGVGKKEEGEVQ